MTWSVVFLSLWHLSVCVCVCRFSTGLCQSRADSLKQRCRWSLSIGRNCWPATLNFSSKFKMDRMNPEAAQSLFKCYTSGFRASVFIMYTGCTLFRALQVRKKTGGENMLMIGDVLAVELSHMQPYIHFCSCQINGATLLQTRIDDEPDFKNFLKVGGRGEWERCRSIRRDKMDLMLNQKYCILPLPARVFILLFIFGCIKSINIFN